MQDANQLTNKMDRKRLSNVRWMRKRACIRRLKSTLAMILLTLGSE